MFIRVAKLTYGNAELPRGVVVQCGGDRVFPDVIRLESSLKFRGGRDVSEDVI
jgi:hypothetical protein